MELRHSGSIARREMHEYSDEELMDIIRSAAADQGVTPLQAIKQSAQEAREQPQIRLISPSG